jgi:hypothetical protein
VRKSIQQRIGAERSVLPARQEMKRGFVLKAQQRNAKRARKSIQQQTGAEKSVLPVKFEMKKASVLHPNNS